MLASCNDPGPIAQGRKTGSDYSHGQMVTYECSTQGYSLVGNPTMTCDDGTWDSQRPQCKGKCFVLYCIICSKLGCAHSWFQSTGAWVTAQNNVEFRCSLL